MPEPGECEVEGACGIDVWFATLDLTQDAPSALAVLSRDETERAARMAPVPQRRFVGSRALLRHLLGGYLSCEPGAVRLAYGGSGKPRLAPAHRASGLHFSLSHAGRRALFAFSPFPVGVDLESVRPLRDLEALAARVFSERERRAFSELPPEARQRAFFAGWTRKEACVKALGTGIANSLQRFAVRLDPSAEPALLGAGGEPDRGWTLRHLEPERDVIGAVAAKRSECSLRCWRLVGAADGPDYAPSRSTKVVS